MKKLVLILLFFLLPTLLFMLVKELQKIPIPKPTPRWVQEVIDRAEQGDADAMSKVGHMYVYAQHGRKQNYDTAILWLKNAADGGSVNAMAMLGSIYFGLRSPRHKNLVEAQHWFRKSSNGGYAYGTYMLGCYARYGWTQEQDIAKSDKLFMQAAKAGQPIAMKILETKDEDAIHRVCHGFSWKKPGFVQD